MTDRRIQRELTEWKIFFQDYGLRTELIQEYLAYARPLLEKNLPIIFEFQHLSKLIGISLTSLAAMVNCPEKFYREFSIPKRRGGKRELISPYPSLLKAQTWILENILNKLTVHSSCHGFVKKRSILTNAIIHKNSESLLKMDLKDFFPSIKQGWVINLFTKLGYAPNVAFYISALCTHKGCLPQGAATSPALANVIANHLDRRLFGLGKSLHLEYSRYADDLAFSGAYVSAKIIPIITAIVQECGFEVNAEKTILFKKGKIKRLTGLRIKDGKIVVPRSLKRKLKQDVYYIKQYGLMSHIGKRKIRDPGYLNKLLGKIAFWRHCVLLS